MTGPRSSQAERNLVVGVGEFKVTPHREAVLVTYALGSCMGVTAFDPKVGAGGLLHFKLPESALNQQMACKKPGVFGDTGMASFLKELLALGATRPHLEIKLIGGSKSLGPSDFFNIGERNLLTARRFLWMNGLIVSKEDTGGGDYRTVRLEMATGRVMVKDPRGTYEL